MARCVLYRYTLRMFRSITTALLAYGSTDILLCEAHGRCRDMSDAPKKEGA